MEIKIVNNEQFSIYYFVTINNNDANRDYRTKIMNKMRRDDPYLHDTPPLFRLILVNWCFEMINYYRILYKWNW